MLWHVISSWELNFLYLIWNNFLKLDLFNITTQTLDSQDLTLQQLLSSLKLGFTTIVTMFYYNMGQLFSLNFLDLISVSNLIYYYWIMAIT